MGKKSKQAGVARPASSEARRDAPAGPPSSPLGRAKWVLAAGDVRRARRYALEAVQSGPEPEREEARALLERIRPDRDSLLAVGAVLLLIVFAAWAALLRAR